LVVVEMLLLLQVAETPVDFHHLQCQIIPAVLRHFLLMVVAAVVVALAEVVVAVAAGFHLSAQPDLHLLVALVEHGRDWAVS
jgi:hypothetical protein